MSYTTNDNSCENIMSEQCAACRKSFSQDFYAAMDNSSVPIYIIDPESFELLYCNKAVAQYFADKDLTGEICYKAIMGRDTPCEDCAAMNVYKNGDNTPIEVYNPMGVWVLVQASMLRWKNKDLVQITCADITKQKQLEEKLRLMNKEYGALVRQSATGVMRYDIATDTAAVNVDRNLDRVDEYMIPDYIRTVCESGLIEKNSMDMAKLVLSDIKKGQPSKGYDLHLSLERDGLRWVHIDYILVRNNEGKPYRAIVSFYDNTEQREREIAYQSWSSRLNALMNGYTAYMEVNLTQNVIEAEGRTGSWDQVMSGRRYSMFVKEMSHIGIYKEDSVQFRKFFNRERLLGQFYAGNAEGSFEYRAVVDEEPRWYKAEVQMVMAPFNKEVKASIVYYDINDEVLERERLTREAAQDTMTGIYNHATTEQLIEQVLSENTGERCCFLMIDLDDLRIINSDLGHPEGDRALKGIADSMKAQFGRSKRNILGRIGGDEFVVLLRDVPEDVGIRRQVSGFMQRIRKIFIGPNNDTPVHASVGGAIGTVGKDDFKTLYEQADLALFYTKATGKNAFNLYVPEFEKRDFQYKPHATVTLTKVEWYASAEFERLLNAISIFFPLVVSGNLTKNTYYIMEYKSYTTHHSNPEGVFDNLIDDGAQSFHPEDRAGFLRRFTREKLLKAYDEGKRTVEYVGRQLGDDGVYHRVQIVSILLQDEKTEDICEVSFTHIIPDKDKNRYKEEYKEI